MDKLWKKETKGGDTCFVNLFENSGIDENIYQTSISKEKYNFNGFEVEPTKNNQISTHFRDAGNVKFEQRCWPEAMEYYNQSLRFAEVGTENVGKAYANRSTCFLRMQKYDQCLIDIGLAQKANYPVQLLPELANRKAECIKNMAETPQDGWIVWGLGNDDANEHFPCMAKVLELRRNEEFGRHIVANCDIKVGRIVLMEEPYFFGADNEKNQSFCDSCAQHNKNFISCSNCVGAMFCNEKCMQNNDTHKLVCGSNYKKDIILQSILVAISTFTSIEDLMEFVQNVFAKRDFNLPNALTDSRSKYESFLNLMALPKKVCKNEEMESVFLHRLYVMLMANGVIKALFDSKPKQRFLMHLMWQHALILRTNAFHSDQEFIRFHFVRNIVSLLNHSCMPNSFVVSDGICQKYMTIRPIKKGEQLFIIYDETLLDEMNAEKRQQFLKEEFHFTCKCSKCLPIRPQAEFNLMELEILLNTDYQIILNNYSPKFEVSSDAERLRYVKKCGDFLNKYGHLPWSKTIDIFMRRLMQFIRLDFNQ